MLTTQSCSNCGANDGENPVNYRNGDSDFAYCGKCLEATSKPAQSVFPADETDTIWEAIRNTVVALGTDAITENIVRRLVTTQRGNARYCNHSLLTMECEREITRTPGGAYVIGRHKPTPANDLTLTSPDALFGQPSLF